MAGQLAVGFVSSPPQPRLAPGAPHPPEPISPPASMSLLLPKGRLKSEGLCPLLSLVIDPRAYPQDALHKHLNRPLSLRRSSFISLCPAIMVTLLRVPQASVHCSGDKIHTLPLAGHSPTSGPPIVPLRHPGPSLSPPAGPDEERVGQAVRGLLKLLISCRPPARPQQCSTRGAVMVSVPLSPPTCASLT